jgi:4-oxalocrotonate tautomerase
MPMIRVDMFSGRTHEQKQKLVKALTDAFVETAGGIPESVHIILTDVEKDHWATAGKLKSDAQSGKEHV